MTRPAFSPVQREKLLIALQMEELIGAINLAMRVRKLVFTLDYAEDHFPRLYMQMPGGPVQKIMQLDQRKHACYISPPSDRNLFHAFVDITERLHKLGGRLALTGDSPPQGQRRVLFQIYVDGANKIALTLMETRKGSRKADIAFQLPDGSTP